MFDTFYSTAAGVSFTLLGLWWVVVQFKHREWARDRLYRRLSYGIMLYFLLPGIMSLLSLLASETKFLWRISFAVAGLLGAIVTISILLSTRSGTNAPRVIHQGGWSTLGIYTLIVLLAVFPELVSQLGVQLQPLEIEAIMVSLLVFSGVNFAWVLFTEPMDDTRSEGG